MKDFTKRIVDTLGLTTLNDINAHVESSAKENSKANLVRLLARCYLKLGEWQSALQEELNDVREFFFSFRGFSIYMPY